jgi:hypothetical protein
MICVFHVPTTPPTYYNMCLMELICVNDSNAKKYFYLNYGVGEYIF